MSIFKNSSLSSKDYWVLLAFILINQLAAYLLGVLTRAEIVTWYAHLEKSTLTPPNWVFATMWPVLYFMISLSAWFLYLNRQHKNIPRAATFFIVQLLINWGWTLIFFYGHFILPSVVWLAALVNFVLLTILSSWRISLTAALLLIPYFLWVVFAFYLNLVVWFLN